MAKFIVKIKGYELARHHKTYFENGFEWVTVSWPKFHSTQQYYKTFHISQCEFVRVRTPLERWISRIWKRIVTKWNNTMCRLTYWYYTTWLYRILPRKYSV